MITPKERQVVDRTVQGSAQAYTQRAPAEECNVDKPSSTVASEQLKLICNSTRRADAAVEHKLTQMRKEQQGDAVCNSKPQSQNTELWMEVIQEDLPFVKKSLARRVILPNLIGKKWLRGYARLLLHQAVEVRA